MSNPTLAPPTTSIQTINISTSELQRISILVYQYIRISVYHLYQHFSHQYISTSVYISTSAYQHHLFCYYFNISSPVLELFSGAARWRRLFSKQANKQTSKQAKTRTARLLGTGSWKPSNVSCDLFGKQTIGMPNCWVLVTFQHTQKLPEQNKTSGNWDL